MHKKKCNDGRGEVRAPVVKKTGAVREKPMMTERKERNQVVTVLTVFRFGRARLFNKADERNLY